MSNDVSYQSPMPYGNHWILEHNHAQIDPLYLSRASMRSPQTGNLEVGAMSRQPSASLGVSPPNSIEHAAVDDPYDLEVLAICRLGALRSVRPVTPIVGIVLCHPLPVPFSRDRVVAISRSPEWIINASTLPGAPWAVTK